MMILTACFLLVAMQEVTAPPNCFQLSNGDVLFEETFNQPLDGWSLATGSGDTPGTESWKQVFGNGALEGDGFIQIDGLDHGHFSCVPKSKFIISPEINVTGWNNLSFTFFRKTTKSQASEPVSNLNALFISADESIPLQERIDTALAKATPLEMFPSKSNEDWRFFGRGLTTNEIEGLGGRFRIAVIYNSVPQSCDNLAIDVLTLRGHSYRAPETIITLPTSRDQTVTVEPGVVIPFGATVLGSANMDAKFFWRIFDLSTSLEICSFVGPMGSYVFPSEGSYMVTCAAYDAQCNVDPTPERRLINVVRDKTIDTEITEPEAEEITLLSGKLLTLKAKSIPGTFSDFNWTITKSDVSQAIRRFNGPTINVSFPETGRYVVTAAAVSLDGSVDPTPDRMVVKVRKGIVEIVAPRAQTDRGEIVIPRNLRVLFRGNVSSVNNVIDEYYWVKNPGRERLCEDASECPIIFNEPGAFTVALVAKSNGQTLGTDFLKVIVDPELTATITQPESNIEVAVNTAVTLKSSIAGRAASTAEVAWSVNGRLVEGKNIEIPGIPKPGRYLARLLARNPQTGFVATDTVGILVFDPSNDALPQILSPKTDVIVKPGERVFFDSSLRNARSENRRPFWEVRKVATQQVLGTSGSPTLGRISFPESGVFEVRFYLRGDDGNQLLEKRTVTSKTGNPAAFSTNRSLESAAPMITGNYYPLDLDRDHYYEIAVPDEGLNLTAKIDVDGPADLVLFDAQGEIVGSRTVKAGVRSLQLQSLPKGNYFLVVRPVANAPKRMVSFSLSLEVLNPSLYYTDINQNQQSGTIIGAVNPTNEDAAVELIAYNKDGSILSKFDTSISAGGSVKYGILDIFPNVASQIAWIRADATRSLVGYTQVSDLSQTKSYAFSAATKLSSELFAPHVAQDLVNWSTRASLVNGIAEESDSFLLSGQNPRQLQNKNSYAQDAFDFLDKFDGTLPEGVEWGWFQENTGKNSLVGNEVFSRKGEFAQEVSLGLVEAPAANPNFVQQGNTFYFTHIARDTNNFWTGIALLNIESVPQNARVRAYGPGGTFVGEKIINLGPSEKQVSLAEIFLDGIGSPENVDWVEIVGDPGVVGYEIFGTWNNKQLAGLEAITERKTDICFPFVDNTGAQWHGFAAVNLSDDATEVTFQLITDSGDVLKTVQRSLPAKAKEIFILATLFDGIPFNAGWVKATATQPIAGFELFGTDETMSGIIAQ